MTARRQGSVFKRCPCGTTGMQAKGSKPAVPACEIKHGTWWWRAEAPSRDPGTGRRRQPSRGGYPTPKAANAALVAYLAERNAGRWKDDQGLTLGQWFDKWLAAGRWEALTRATYESHIRSALRPHLGATRLRDLQKFHVEDMLREAAKRAGGGVRMPRTLSSYRRTLSACLTAAMDAGLISENAAKGRMKSIPKTGRPDLLLWQADELRLFLSSPVVVSDPFLPLWIVAAYTGLRRAELCGLRWADVDLTGAYPGVDVRQTVVALAGRHPCGVCGDEHTGALIKVFSETGRGTKSDAGKRWVPLVAEARAALAAHRVKQETRQEQWGEGYRDHQLVFPKDDGTPVNPSALTQRFKRLVTSVRDPEDPEFRLPVIRPHDMRHASASLMIAAGVPMEVVSLIMGHSSTAITRQIYAHTLRGPATDALEAAAKLVRDLPRARSVHSWPGSSEVRRGSETLTGRSDDRDPPVTPEPHCITNSDELLTDTDGDCDEEP